MTNKIVTINSRKFDGKVDKSWQAELIAETDDILIFMGVFNKQIKHSQLGIIQCGTVSYEYYWKNKWFNIFRFHEPEGTLRNFYCNINMPPTFENDILDYIDLDIDVLVWKDLNYQILDSDEFQTNADFYNYPDEILAKIKTTLDELLNFINTKTFPFDITD